MDEPTATDSRRHALRLLVAVTMAGLSLIAGGVPLFDQWQQARSAPPLQRLGLPARDAGCGQVLDDPVESSRHVGWGTDNPDVDRVSYATVPPTSGPHFITPSPFNRRFYTLADRPAMEQLVHNLEHGYVVVWYDDTVPRDQLAALRILAGGGPASAQRLRFIVTPWDPRYGDLGTDRHVAIAAWGHRQTCRGVSGAEITRFRRRFPVTAAPEPMGG
jgi:hypothetical protein